MPFIFAGFDDGVDDRCAIATGIGTAEEIVFRPRAKGLIARSAALLLISSRPSVA